MKKFTVIFFMALMPFLMGCKEMNLTMEDSGKTINLSKGDVVHVTLVSNRSTGNTWRKIEFDKQVLQEVSDPVYKMDRENLIGAAGKVTYSFRALKKGVSRLYMEYGPMDQEKTALKTFEVEIVVK
jgi:predicted secreted protein